MEKKVVSRRLRYTLWIFDLPSVVPILVVVGNKHRGDGPWLRDFSMAQKKETQNDSKSHIPAMNCGTEQSPFVGKHREINPRASRVMFHQSFIEGPPEPETYGR